MFGVYKQEATIFRKTTGESQYSLAFKRFIDADFRRQFENGQSQH
ncbi:protein of unknown function [Legionella fallonii LLAP-10]|uniref:Uncharacterized protein n=1 Tax=Legionella fallonii LLAP-10 TaxID=1212491 RepID=A0A098G6H7_9GAMM|nr:protein of unknown function [Legionella fallonii LLAP-10]